MIWGYGGGWEFLGDGINEWVNVADCGVVLARRDEW